MSNLERKPDELHCTSMAAHRPAPVEVIQPREVPLGGPRAMTVRRTLPTRGRTLIGAWCFADHYGPDDVAETGGMVVPPHPHTGLQTVSWLFTGEVEHRDSLGTHAMVRPGELNLMTAGRGISHSEVSTAATTVLHGAQLWTVLPGGTRDTAPAFEHHVPETVPIHGGELRVFMGALAGVASPVELFSPLLGAELVLQPGARVSLGVDPTFEHGVLVDAGEVTVQESVVAHTELGYVAPGAATLTLGSGEHGARVLLLGGEPFGEEIVMWWNFIGRSHDEVVGYREQWQTEITGAGGHPRFGTFRYDGEPLPAPAMPGVRLRPRS